MLARHGIHARMKRHALRALIVVASTAVAFCAAAGAAAAACEFDFGCPTSELDGGAATVEYTGAAVGALVARSPDEAARYEWRLRHLCAIRDENVGTCASSDFRPC